MQAGRLPVGTEGPSSVNALQVRIEIREGILFGLLTGQHTALALVKIRDLKAEIVGLRANLAEALAPVSLERLAIQRWAEKVQANGYATPEKRDVCVRIEKVGVGANRNAKKLKRAIAHKLSKG